MTKGQKTKLAQKVKRRKKDTKSKYAKKNQEIRKKCREGR